MIFKQNNHLSIQELNDITTLAKACQQADGVVTKIYWDIINKKRQFTGNFLCYENTTLIGYLSFFLFDENAAHISAMVHPNHRRQHLFLQLLHAASLEISKFNINKLTFSFPKQNHMARECVKKFSAQLQSLEYGMQRTSQALEVITNNPLTVQRATSNDIALITHIDTLCFNSDHAQMLQRFTETIASPDRQIWLAYLNNECIGKCHIQFDQQGAYIHDLCILPSHQGHGYGSLLLKSVINHLIETDSGQQIYLEVTTSNESALSLYLNCHFTITHTYEYWAT